MAIYTYWGNKDPQDGTTALGVLSGVINIGQYGDFTTNEIIKLLPRYDLRLGALAWTRPATYPWSSPQNVLPPSADGSQLVNIPPYKTGTLYQQGYVVQYGGIAYTATATFTSGASFVADGVNWAPLSSAELAYSQVTSYVDVPTVAADVTGLSVTVVVASRPILLIIDAQLAQISTAGNFGGANIMEGATILASGQWGGGPAGDGYPLHREVRLAPSAGSHTYKVQTGIVIGTHGANDRIQATATSPFSFSCRQV